MKSYWLAPFCLLLISCHAVEFSERVSYQYQQNTLAKDVWQAIEIGVTDKQWLLQHIGPPSSIQNLSDKQIYTYRYEAIINKKDSVFLFYQNQKTEVSKKIHSVSLKKDIVVEHSDLTPIPLATPSNELASQTAVISSPSGTPINGTQNTAAEIIPTNQEPAVEERAPAEVEMPQPLNRDL